MARLSAVDYRKIRDYVYQITENQAYPTMDGVQIGPLKEATDSLKKLEWMVPGNPLIIKARIEHQRLLELASLIVTLCRQREYDVAHMLVGKVDVILREIGSLEQSIQEQLSDKAN
ncbi:MAG: hypothetical protein HUU10_12300 [Bacteroidetes bacterium]|nr:hypothetical protein [Bacteroidota bacterium]